MSQVTVLVWPTLHIVFASGLVIGGSNTTRGNSGKAWMKEANKEKHRIVNANIIKTNRLR